MGDIEQWERASSEPARVTPPQPRRTAAPVTPAARVAELTRMLEQERKFLAEACVEIRRLRSVDDTYHRMSGVSFGGVAAAQWWCDFVLWEAVLNENPDLVAIVEIGTWQGGFSRWLNAQAETRGMGFLTYDAVAPDREPPGFVRRDVFAEADFIRGHVLREEPLVLFCDGGNKPREMATFAPCLCDSRSLVVVHDWGTETLPSDVPACLEEAYGDYCDELGSLSRVFRVRP